MNLPALVISQEALEETLKDAACSPRRRKNLNVHQDLAAPVQRLFNAMEPGTYIRVHRHARPNGWELMLCMAGQFSVLLFEDDGCVQERIDLHAEGPLRGVEVPPNTWHTVISRSHGTLMFEVKEGPYQPLDDKDFAPWMPDEASPSASIVLQWLESAQPGDYPMGPITP